MEKQKTAIIFQIIVFGPDLRFAAIDKPFRAADLSASRVKWEVWCE
jgi:hypothetical protein